jgi:hypothetical protein
LVRIAASFALVVAAYVGYWLAVVPWIEPAADPRAAEQISDDDFSSSDVASRVHGLGSLFPPGSWQLKNPMILQGENKQSTMLFYGYHDLGNGLVRLDRCSIVMDPGSATDDPAQRIQRSIVLDAPEGARLQFDKPLQLGRAEIGRVTGGTLIGPVTIRSQGRTAEESLRIDTRDVELSERHVWTPNPVDFRFGHSYGRGREMHIHLLPGEPPKGAGQTAPSLGGLESFEMAHVERLHLEPNAPKKPPASSAAPVAGPAGPGPVPPALGSDAPLEIACHGPMHFDMATMEATFRDQVDVLRLVPNGPGDQLGCELLTIYFAPKRTLSASTAKKPPPKQPRLADLEPRRIQAEGDPATLCARSQRLEASGQRLQYDLWNGQVALDSTAESWLRQPPNEIHARSLHYQPATTAGRLGLVTAPGPGWFRGLMDPAKMNPASPASRANPPSTAASRPPQQVEARWQDQLLVRPQGANQVISLTGGAGLKLPDVGQIDAREIHFWLNEIPQPGTTATKLQPDRMLALHDVRFQAAQIDGNVDHMEVWFEQVPAASPTGEPPPRRRFEPSSPPVAPPAAAAPGVGHDSRQFRIVAYFPDTPAAPATTGPYGVPVASAVPVASVAPGAPAAPQQHFWVSGRLLRARVLLAEQQPAVLAELMIQENVMVRQTQTARPSDRPLVISGDELHAIDPTLPQAVMTIVGRPAHFEGRGMELDGPQINLDSGANRLWVDGAGRMRLPMDRDMEGHLLAQPTILDIDWQKRMTFDGRVAFFEDAVNAVAPQGQLRSPTLEVRLRETIRFGDRNFLNAGPAAAPGADVAQGAGQAPPPEVERIICRYAVQIQTATFDTRGQSALERLDAADLNVDRVTGDVRAAGPGYLHRVTRGSMASLLPGPTVAPPRATPVKTVAMPANDQLIAQAVRFQGPLTGNIQRKTAEFHDQVRAAQAGVDQWQAVIDPDRPEQLGPQYVTLHCDLLQVAQMPTPIEGRGTAEMQALGNANVEFHDRATRPAGDQRPVEAPTYFGRALSIRYAQAKGWVCLEGDGWTDAELFRQQQIGGPVDRLPAKQIYYWPATRATSVNGARSLEFNSIPPGKMWK